MLEFVRRLFRRKPKRTEYVYGLHELAMRRSEEKLPCCGGKRQNHAHFRSGKLLCPEQATVDVKEFVDKCRLNLRHHPLSEDEDFFPPWSERHFKCSTCGCARGVHCRELFKRTMCMDPDCPGCPKGCT